MMSVMPLVAEQSHDVIGEPTADMPALQPNVFG
jgi:hypothetical protein